MWDETGRETVLLVDGWNCLRGVCLCCFTTDGLLLGGQMRAFVNNVKDFLAGFQATEDPNAFFANFFFVEHWDVSSMLRINPLLTVWIRKTN